MKQRDFEKSLLSNLFRPETREEPARFFESGLRRTHPRSSHPPGFSNQSDFEVSRVIKPEK
jgi:hypothetical protein